MAHLGGFDATNVAPVADFDPLPAGKYVAQIVESELKPTKAGTGEYLNLTFEILEGEHQGRRLWSRLNLNNPSAGAVKIAKAELSAICRAVGIMAPGDSIELHNLPMVIDVKVKKRSDTGELGNEIKNYSPRNSRLNAAATAPVSANGAAAPWARS